MNKLILRTDVSIMSTTNFFANAAGIIRKEPVDSNFYIEQRYHYVTSRLDTYPVILQYGQMEIDEIYKFSESKVISSSPFLDVGSSIASNWKFDFKINFIKAMIETVEIFMAPYLFYTDYQKLIDSPKFFYDEKVLYITNFDVHMRDVFINYDSYDEVVEKVKMIRGYTQIVEFAKDVNVSVVIKDNSDYIFIYRILAGQSPYFIACGRIENLRTTFYDQVLMGGNVSTIALSNDINERMKITIDAIAKRFDEIEYKVSKIDDQVSKNNDQIKLIDKKLDTKVDSLLSDISTLRNRQVNNSDRIATIERLLPIQNYAGKTVYDTIQDSITNANLQTQDRINVIDEDLDMIDSDIKAMQDNGEVQNKRMRIEIDDISKIVNSTRDEINAVSVRLTSQNQTIMNTINPKVDDIGSRLTDTYNRIIESEERIKKILQSINEINSTSSKYVTMAEAARTTLVEIEKYSSTGRITRRQGYYECPPIGLFTGSTVLVTNEGHVLHTNINLAKNVVLLNPKTTIQNYRMLVRISTPNIYNVCFLLFNDAEEKESSNELVIISSVEFTSIVGKMRYATIRIDKPTNINYVLYLTTGGKIYV